MLVKVQVLLDLMRYEEALETLSEVKDQYNQEEGVIEQAERLESVVKGAQAEHERQEKLLYAKMLKSRGKESVKKEKEEMKEVVEKTEEKKAEESSEKVPVVSEEK